MKWGHRILIFVIVTLTSLFPIHGIVFPRLYPASTFRPDKQFQLMKDIAHSCFDFEEKTWHRASFSDDFVLTLQEDSQGITIQIEDLLYQNLKLLYILRLSKDYNIISEYQNYSSLDDAYRDKMRTGLIGSMILALLIALLAVLLIEIILWFYRLIRYLHHKLKAPSNHTHKRRKTS